MSKHLYASILPTSAAASTSANNSTSKHAMSTSRSPSPSRNIFPTTPFNTSIRTRSSSSGPDRLKKLLSRLFKPSRWPTMDFELAAWQMSYLCIAPRRVSVPSPPKNYAPWALFTDDQYGCVPATDEEYLGQGRPSDPDPANGDDGRSRVPVESALSAHLEPHYLARLSRPLHPQGLLPHRLGHQHSPLVRPTSYPPLPSPFSSYTPTYTPHVRLVVLSQGQSRTISSPIHRTLMPRINGRRHWKCIQRQYAFDIHTNSFFPLFLNLYVLQLILAPLVLRHNWLSLPYLLNLHPPPPPPQKKKKRIHKKNDSMKRNFYYVTYLGYNSLPFLIKSEILLIPILLYTVLYFISLLGLNIASHVLTCYFDPFLITSSPP
ncbi:hypothetical protein VP01_1539g2 [Puccinia sorghi]|uniref:Uncharacterized protein n=1 Tax=Puccinia sorghi TaxID=27349 RepID=A0A0L6VK94_9BASI|nr:hypothetical protein VP01_1539g2 [Puccinia sorghi]